MWWRIFAPTWRFFDTVEAQPELLAKTNGEWQPVIQRPRFRWYSLFFNPEGGLYHARMNLLERLVQEIAEGDATEKLVSYALVRDLVGQREFKIIVAGETVLHSRETAP